MSLLISVFVAFAVPASLAAAEMTVQIGVPPIKSHMVLANYIDDMMASESSTESLFGEDGFFDFFGNLTGEQQKDAIDRAYPDLTAKWNGTNIFVCWEEFSEKFAAPRAVVQTAIQDTWEAASALKFVGWGQCSATSKGIRISVQDLGPHVQKLGKYVDGIPNGMILNFTYKIFEPQCGRKKNFDNCTRVFAIHEFGHAIGFSHEQNRPDTPGECSVRKKPQGPNGNDIEMTEWDPKSVMNYCIPGADKLLGVLSDFDKIAVQKIYGEA